MDTPGPSGTVGTPRGFAAATTAALPLLNMCYVAKSSISEVLRAAAPRVRQPKRRGAATYIIATAIAEATAFLHLQRVKLIIVRFCTALWALGGSGCAIRPPSTRVALRRLRERPQPYTAIMLLLSTLIV